MKQEGGPSPFKDKIGPGTPLIKTKHGWINIFQEVRNTMDGNPYVLWVALHDLSDQKKKLMNESRIYLP